MSSLSAAEVKRPSPASGRSDAVHFIGQVTGILTDSIVAVWDLDGLRGFEAYGVSILNLKIGALVRCRLSRDLRFVESIALGDAELEEAYKNKRLLP